MASLSGRQSRDAPRPERSAETSRKKCQRWHAVRCPSPCDRRTERSAGIASIQPTGRGGSWVPPAAWTTAARNPGGGRTLCSPAPARLKLDRAGSVNRRCTVAAAPRFGQPGRAGGPREIRRNEPQTANERRSAAYTLQHKVCVAACGAPKESPWLQTTSSSEAQACSPS